MERLFFKDAHNEDGLRFQAGQFYNVDDEALREKVIQAGIAVPESEAMGGYAEAEAERARLAEILKVPPPPEIPPIEVKDNG